VLYFFLPQFIKPDFGQISTFEDEVARFIRSPLAEAPATQSLTPFPFDPNKSTGEELQQLGLSEKQTEMILRYRNAGGKFRSAEDFGKMYSISEAEFFILQPFIVIENDQTPANDRAKIREKHALIPFPFDPNTIDSADLARMGLRDVQVRNVMNYRKSGGAFKTKGDFGKLYTISAEDYSQVEKFILLPSVDTVNQSQEQLLDTPLIVELNKADTTALRQIKGIGPAFARRIVSYRDKLGGFFDKSQLLEVFGMDTTRYVQVAANLEVDIIHVRKMNLNTTPFKEMVSHPYLEFYIVKAIFEYKESKGRFDSVPELKQINLIYQQLYQKLENYFMVDGQTTKNQ
jgi:competence protein ComEA